MNMKQKIGLQWKSILLSVFLLGVVVLGIVYVKKPQDIRNKAALSGAVLSMSPSSVNKGVGSTFSVGIILNSGPYTVTGTEVHVQYNPSILEITGFTPGKPLPVVLAQPSISSGNASVTLGAQPNVYLKGSDIIGTFTVKALTDKPASITFTSETIVSALEKETSALVSSAGISINGTEPTPVATCDASNTGSYCKRCQPCPEGRICTKECKLEVGVCKDSQCVVDAPAGCYYKQVQCVQAPCNPILVCPTPTPGQNSCTNAKNGSSCTIGSCPTCTPGKPCPAIACIPQSGTCQNGQCIANCTQPPKGCVDENGNLSLCDPMPGVTWCRPTPKPTCIPLPECVYNPPIVNGKPVRCDVMAPPNGNTYCPRPTASPTPTAHNWCPGPNGTQCNWDCNTCNAAGGCTKMKCPTFLGTCQNNVCVRLNVTATPTPTPPVGCFYQEVQCIQAPCNPILVCPTKTPTPTVSPTPIASGSQIIDLRVKLAGVTDGSANGAKVGIKFVKLGGETLQLSSALALVYVGNGVYKAEATLSNPLPFGTKFRIKVKGEKHLTSEFCYQVGQTGPCKDTEYITMPNFIAQTYGFDLTGLPLQPGDVSPQDGKVDTTDFTAIKSLMSKLCSELTTQEKLKADLDYNGCVTVKDIFLIRQTLETRYDE